MEEDTKEYTHNTGEIRNDSFSSPATTEKGFSSVCADVVFGCVLLFLLPFRHVFKTKAASYLDKKELSTGFVWFIVWMA